MAVNCKSENRETYSSKKSKFKIPITNISYIIKIVKMLISMPDFPSPSINKYLIFIGNKTRPGLNKSVLAAKIINRKSEAGVPTTPLPSGGDNLDLKMERIRAEETVNELITKAKISITIDPQAIQVVGTGNFGFPVSSQNPDVIAGYGVIS